MLAVELRNSRGVLVAFCGPCSYVTSEKTPGFSLTCTNERGRKLTFSPDDFGATIATVVPYDKVKHGDRRTLTVDFTIDELDAAIEFINSSVGFPSLADTDRLSSFVVKIFSARASTTKNAGVTIVKNPSGTGEK